MGYSLVSGIFTEDFNYGNPYGEPIAPFPPEFTYSNAEKTHTGEVTPSDYARNQFSLQVGSLATNPLNNDHGTHNGGPNDGYYLLFPRIGWGEVQTLTLQLYLSESCILSFLRSWDGYINDIVSVVVNSIVQSTYSNSAGHGWTETALALPKGANTITWVLETVTQAAALRNGQAYGSNNPELTRYLRLATLEVAELFGGTGVTSITFPKHSYVSLSGTGTLTVTTAADLKAAANWIGAGSFLTQGSTIAPSGTCLMQGFASFITDYLTDIQTVFSITGEGDILCDATIGGVHSSVDAGFTLNATGELTVDIPIDTTQTVQELIRPIVTTVITMTTPVISAGLPITPTYQTTQSTSLSSADTYTYNNAIDPASIDHVLPHTPTYRWVSVDITGGPDANVYAWPERNGGPSFDSADPFAPTIHPHIHFNEKDLSYTEYAQVITFYWRYVQHMWVDLSTQTAPFTWTFVGLFNPSTSKQWQHILCSGYSLTDPAAWADDVQDGVSVVTSAESSYTGNSFFGLYEDGAVLLNPNFTGYSYIKGHIDWRPAIYTIVYTGANTYLYARHRNHKWKRTSTINNSTGGKFLLGRQVGTVGEDQSAHMSLLEVCFKNSLLTEQQVLDNEDYLMGVYGFENYV